MKSAFIIQPQQDFADFVAFARDEGIDGVELMYYRPTAVEAFSHVAERKRVLDDHDVAVSAVATWHLGLADPPGSGSADIIERGMDYAAELGASCFFTGAGEPGRDHPAAALADCYEAWRARAEERGLDFCVYLGHEGSYIDSEDVRRERSDRRRLVHVRSVWLGRRRRRCRARANWVRGARHRTGYGALTWEAADRAR